MKVSSAQVESFNDNWISYAQNKNAKKYVEIDTSQGAAGSNASLKISYSLKSNSSISVTIGKRGRTTQEMIHEIKNDENKAYDIRQFKKICFSVKSEKEGGIFSRPNKVLPFILCYSKDAMGTKQTGSDPHHRIAYYKKAGIRPTSTWKEFEVYFDEFVPSARTKRKMSNYPKKPELKYVMHFAFVVSSWKPDGGYPEKNTIWIDDIRLE